MDSRWLDRDAVARHISVRVDHIPRLVRAGKLPAPSMHLGARSPRWDRDSLDALFGAKVRQVDPDDTVRNAAEQIERLKRGRARRS
jgi:hypothetical protein